jgi:hypothetical protein
MATPTERASREFRAARANRRPPSFVVTLLALALVFALAWMFFLRSGPAAPTPNVEGIQGTYEWGAEAPAASGVPRETGTFSAVASGDAGGRMTWRDTAPRTDTSGSADSAYDAVRREETTIRKRTGRLGTRTTQTRRGDVWPPVWRVATRSPLDYQGLAAIVRAAVEDGDDTVGIKPLEDDDRTVWRAAMTLDGALIDLVVDQQTGIVTWYSDDESTFTALVDWDSPPPADAAYYVDAQGDKPRTVTDETYTYATSPAAAGSAAGYDPLVSDFAPDGYALKAVATADTMGAPGDWLVGDGHSAPVAVLAGETQVAQLYTRGLGWFTMQQLGPATAQRSVALLRDTLESIAPDKLSLQVTTLEFGELTGATAYTWYQETGPTLFVSDASHVVFVTGALTRQELVAFAEGLRPVAAYAPD